MRCFHHDTMAFRMGLTRLWASIDPTVLLPIALAPQTPSFDLGCLGGTFGNNSPTSLRPSFLYPCLFLLGALGGMAPTETPKIFFELPLFLSIFLFFQSDGCGVVDGGIKNAVASASCLWFALV